MTRCEKDPHYHSDFEVGRRNQEEKKNVDSKETDSPQETSKECGPANTSVLAH